MEFTWKHKLGLIVFGLSLAFLAVEAALRILAAGKSGSEFEDVNELRRVMMEADAPSQPGASVSFRSIVEPHPDDKIIYTLRPNLDVKFQQKPTKTNSCGMRDVERSITKPANTYRIALLGDSFVFGWGVEQQETFAAQLEKNLNALSTDGTNFEVLNFGVPGYSTFQEVRQFKTAAVDFDPDAVILFFIRNDFGFPFFVRNLDSGSRGLQSASKFVNLLNKAANPDLEAQKLEMMELDPNRSIKELSDFTRERGIKLFVAINPKKGWINDYRRLWVLKDRKDIRIMYMRRNYLNSIKTRQIPEPDLTLSHDPHPSPLRHELYADLMTPYFMDIAK